MHYVFRSHIGGREVALVEQLVFEQSPEEHYALEDSSRSAPLVAELRGTFRTLTDDPL